MYNISRRTLLGTFAALSASPVCRHANAVEPIVHQGMAPYRLSLAAYSLRSQLPNYRAGANPAPAPMDMFKFISYCAELGIGGAEITAYYLPDPPPARLLKELKRHAHCQGITISGGAIGNQFADPDPQVFAEQLRYLQRWLEAYSILGAPVIRVFAGTPPAETNPEAAELLIVDRLSQACEIAANHGVMLALENHDFTTNIPRFLRILRAVDSTWFGANLDTGNLSDTDDPYAAVAQIVPYAINAQIKSEIPVSNRPVAADYARLVQLLQQGGYRGHVVLEYEGENPLQEIPRHLRRLQEALPQPTVPSK